MMDDYSEGWICHYGKDRRAKGGLLAASQANRRTCSVEGVVVGDVDGIEAMVKKLQQI